MDYNNLHGASRGQHNYSFSSGLLGRNGMARLGLVNQRIDFRSLHEGTYVILIAICDRVSRIELVLFTNALLYNHESRSTTIALRNALVMSKGRPAGPCFVNGDMMMLTYCEF
jgi:hypothetical protein